MSKITIEEYQAFTPTTFIVGEARAPAYLDAGLAAEVGEYLGHVAKFIRGDFGGDELDGRLRKELGDIMYFISQIANIHGWDLRDIMQENKDKLEDRMNRNQIKGDGDER